MHTEPEESVEVDAPVEPEEQDAPDSPEGQSGPEGTEEEAVPGVEESLYDLTTEEVEQRRRSAAAELERREQVAQGQERVGQAAYDYLIAARLDCEHTPAELGQIIIDHITAEPESESEPESEPEQEEAS